jgi:hypothetical protein
MAGTKETQKAMAATRDESEEESAVDFVMGGEPEKDEEELELERVLFGDSAGFRQGLGQIAAIDDEPAGEDEGTTGLQGLEDADVGLGPLRLPRRRRTNGV